jgi:hypothetical protein
VKNKLLKLKNMNEKIKYLIIGLLIGIIAFPTITFGATFVSSLIQGKSVEQAIQILTEQINSLNGRVAVIEKDVQTQQVEKQNNENKPTQAVFSNNPAVENPVVPNPVPVPVQPSQPVPVISIEQQKAPKIISVSDNLGNVHMMDCNWSETHYECSPKDGKQITVSVASTPEITFTINASDPNGKPLTYDYYYEGGCQLPDTNWITGNSCTTNLRKLSFGVHNFIFDINNNDNYGSVGLDATTVLYYDLEE